MAKAKKQTKAEELQEAVAEAVGAGRELHLESVDFSDPNRPKTCLEIDFPILPINTIATIEGKGSGALKPVYQTMKWWARRRSTVFRQLLIAAATKAPPEETDAAKVVWDGYYANHQKNEAFRKLKVADIFMGGGTTIVEGARLGMQMYGNDLNPVAWLVVKNELAQVDPNQVQKLLDDIEAEVKPQIMPFYACDCPRGHKGRWTHKSTGKVMDEHFDPLSLTPKQRPEYEYKGPEVIYTFWAKHGPCQATDCRHRTPLLSSPVVTYRTASVRGWLKWSCSQCAGSFDIEPEETRLSPQMPFVLSQLDSALAVMDSEGRFTCPHCKKCYQDEKAKATGQSSSLGKLKSRSVTFTLLVHPSWMKGEPQPSDNSLLGGTNTDLPEATELWNTKRASSLTIIEVRGTLPDTVRCPVTGVEFSTGLSGGSIPRKSTFACGSCGREQDVLGSVKATGKSGPMAMYAVQCYCPECDDNKAAFSGRYFAYPDVRSFDSANSDWALRRETDLHPYWPRCELSQGWKTHGWSIPQHGYSHYWKMFNERQLFVHSLLLKSIATNTDAPGSVRDVVIGVFQQYLRNQNMFCFWNNQRALEPMFSNNNYHPKMCVVENTVFSGLGRGDFRSCGTKLLESLEWCSNPWEIVCMDDSGHSTKVPVGDAVCGEVQLSCASASELNCLESESIDLVVTDPPFGEIMQYAELSDFFYVWLRLLLREKYPAVFETEYTPKVLEAVSNPNRHSEPESFYQRILTECWRESVRVLKPSGLLVFTFHHSEDEPWVAVLQSLFDAGLILEGTFPIRSDETKGKGEFGSQKIEFDIVHVCRKRLEEPEPISWARLRRQIMKDVRQLQEIIEQHQKEGLGEADLQVIRRGKALEYYSRHYGKVYIEKGREEEFTVRDALVGINQLLDDESDTTSETPPVLAEPYTRQFLRLFADKGTLERDQMQKHLRGTGVSPSEFLERGWCSEEKKVFTVADPLEWANQWKGKSRKGMSRDFDQTYFLIGACYDDSGIKLSDTLNSGSFVPHPAISDLLDWFGKHGSDSNMKAASKRAKQIYSSWLAKNTTQVVTQRTLFDLEDE